MMLSSTRVYDFISISLAALLVVVGVYLWYLDLFSMQRTFALFFASELLTFSMLTYVYLRARDSRVGNMWLLLGCVALAGTLILALEL